MKKRYKGYFKKPTNTLNEMRFTKIVIKELSFTEKPRVGLWVKTYLKYIKKL